MIILTAVARGAGGGGFIPSHEILVKYTKFTALAVKNLNYGFQKV